MPRAHTSMRPEILLVDDDELTLRSLRRFLKARRPQWHVRTASDVRKAMQSMALHPVDACVSDVEMGTEGGIELLGHVALRWPETVRVLYCGSAPDDLGPAAVEVAHQAVMKSADPQALIDAIENGLTAGASISDRALWALVAGPNRLPPAPSVFPELERAAADDRTTAQDLTAIIARDHAVAARVLQLATSAFVGLPPHVRSLEGAVGWLGLRTIRGLVLSVEVLQGFGGTLPHALSATQLALHAFRVAEMAARIARRVAPGDAETSYLAGVVHDLGVLVLGSRARERYSKVLAFASEREIPLHHAERTLLGLTHADVGATVLEMWGLDPGIVDAVRRHHQAHEGRWDAARAVFVANHLVSEADEQVVEELPATAFKGLSQERLARWRSRLRG